MAQRYTYNDQFLIDSFSMVYPSKVKQEFQFPPKITADMMSGNFKSEADGKATPGIYPGYSYAGPNERYWSIETSYIIDSSSKEKAGWNAGRVKSEVEKYRTYYFYLKLWDSETNVIEMKLWGMGGKKPGRAFMRNLSIKHSGPLITSSGDVNYTYKGGALDSGTKGSNIIGAEAKNVSLNMFESIYPLRTDVSFDLVYWDNFKSTESKSAKSFPREWF